MTSRAVRLSIGSGARDEVLGSRDGLVEADGAKVVWSISLQDERLTRAQMSRREKHGLPQKGQGTEQ